MIDKNKKIDNLKRLLHEDGFNGSGYLNLEDLVAIRATNYLNNDKNNKEILWPSPVRPTIHFSLNHLVKSHLYGNWDDVTKYYIIPFKDLIEKNKQNFIGGLPVDVFFLGPIKLPKNYTIIEKRTGETNEDFKTRVEQEIENKGYLVVLGGQWSWAGSGDYELEQLFNKLGPYIETAHINTILGVTEEKVDRELWNLLTTERKLSEKEKQLKENLLKDADFKVNNCYSDGTEISINTKIYRQYWLNTFKKILKEAKKNPRDFEMFYMQANIDKQLKVINYKRLKKYLDEWVYNYMTDN